MKLKNILSAGILSLTALTSCGDKYSVKEHPADQVFVDSSGYRVIYTDENGEIIQQVYGLGNQTHISKVPLEMREHFKTLKEAKNETIDYKHTLRVFRTLPAGERGLVRVLHKEGIGGGVVCTEILLPKDQKLSPGTAHYQSGKTTINKPMGEIDY